MKRERFPAEQIVSISIRDGTIECNGPERIIHDSNPKMVAGSLV
jgi:hypothetical protein